MHVYNFFTDTLQHNLKIHARSTAIKGRFENVLSDYFDLMVSNIKKLNETDETTLPEELKNNIDLKKWFQKLAGYTKGLEEKICQLLDDIHDCYLIFIRGKHHSAVIKMHDILEKYDLLDFAFHELLGGFFRIRKPGKDEDIFNESFNYHLPYSKRHLVSNQRFSFSGIPLLYLGGSVMDCYFEYDVSDLNNTEFGITFFGFNPLADHQLHPSKGYSRIQSKEKIFDITNQIFDVIHDVFYEIIKEGKNLKQMVFPALEHENLVRLIMKFVLSQVCTFPKKAFVDNQVFFEEYVIPQLVTEAIRLHKYDGILYPSTKFAGKNIEFKTAWKSNLYKTNLAMFTDYDRHSEHDVGLLKNFVCVTREMRNFKNYDYPTILNLLKEEINNTIKFLQERGQSEIQIKYLTVLHHISKKLRLYEDMKFNEIPYLETFAGKADIQHLREYFISIVKLVQKTYHNELERLELENELNKDMSDLQTKK